MQRKSKLAVAILIVLVAASCASSGDIIVVYPGTYSENLFVDRPLTIISNSGNPADAVIQAVDTETVGVWSDPYSKNNS